MGKTIEIRENGEVTYSIFDELEQLKTELERVKFLVERGLGQ